MAGRLILIEHNCMQADFGHYAIALRLLCEGARRRGLAVTPFVNRRCAPALLQELGAVAAFPSGTQGQGLSLKQLRTAGGQLTTELDQLRGRLVRWFEEGLRAALGQEPSAEDLLLVLTADLTELLALARHLSSLPEERRPRALACVHSLDRFETPARGYPRERYLAMARWIKARGIAPWVRLGATTPGLAAALFGLTGLEVDVLGWPGHWPSGDARTADGPCGRPRSAEPTVVLLGGGRRDQGLDGRRTAAAASALLACPERFRLLIRHREASAATEAGPLEAPDASQRVTATRGLMPSAVYWGRLAATDFAICPYPPRRFRFRLSAQFVDAVGLGTPAVAVRSTWMADEIEAGHAAGVVADSGSPTDLALAARELCRHLARHRARAQELAPAWRARFSAATFLDRVLAACGPPNRPPRP